MDPSSLQPETSALLGTPQNSTHPTIQEPPPEHETSPIQEARNEVSINVCPFLFNKPSLIRHFFFSRLGCITTKLFFYRGCFNCRKRR
jgi:hypothetical protein